MKNKIIRWLDRHHHNKMLLAAVCAVEVTFVVVAIMAFLAFANGAPL